MINLLITPSIDFSASLGHSFSTNVAKMDYTDVRKDVYYGQEFRRTENEKGHHRAVD